LIRWNGANPALITVDGRNYFCGKLDGVYDGATELEQLVRELAEGEKLKAGR
jgi:predicted Rdx family selenoprotein